MERVALHTRLKAGMEDTYDSEHSEIPPALTEALREAGVHSWRIWRDGVDVFHVVECDDFVQMREFLNEHPANVPWQAQMGRLLDVTYDYSGDEPGLKFVWELH